MGTITGPAGSRGIPLGVFEVTCHTGKGITASGRPASCEIVSVDRRLVPFGTRLLVDQFGLRIATDTAQQWPVTAWTSGSGRRPQGVVALPWSDTAAAEHRATRAEQLARAHPDATAIDFGEGNGRRPLGHRSSPTASWSPQPATPGTSLTTRNAASGFVFSIGSITLGGSLPGDTQL